MSDLSYSIIPNKYKTIIQNLNIIHVEEVRYVKYAKGKRSLYDKESINYVSTSRVQKKSWLDDSAIFNKIPESVSCYMAGNVEVVIDVKNHPALCESLMLYCKSKYTISKLEKYLLAFKAYEGLEKNIKIEFSAIRHALSHNKKKLTRKSTLETLESIFGTIDLDLSKTKHTKIYYRYYIDLLVEVDKLLHQKILVLLHNHHAN